MKKEHISKSKSKESRDVETKEERDEGSLLAI